MIFTTLIDKKSQFTKIWATLPAGAQREEAWGHLQHKRHIQGDNAYP